MNKNSEQKTGVKRLLKILFWLPVVILIVAVVIGALSGVEKGRKRNLRPTIGEQARDFAFVDLEGNEISLSGFYGEKVVFVNIWATWCPSCREELPTLQRLYEKFRGDDFEVLAVSIDAAGGKAVAPYMKKHRYTFPALLDTAGSVQLLYGTTGVPESFIIDKKGKVAFVEIGPGDWTDPKRQALIRGLMEEPDMETGR
ncbi:thiol-disulfide oxidoreductase ResA [bacterium BMS3Abin10]|nr:thiol-disulfide oxidoreductase ResA [bacterium BMS3Abin10]GBE39737.1 thiol-disulfide oxidoreductase ResA [bacterium BMS3Bbin08]HDH50190.1 TlpA family protein disulfide reductase [Nitrospirota bacterium]